MIAATQHDKFALLDYHRLWNAGIQTARDGVRWHLIEASRHHYEFASLLPQVRAACDAGVEVIWDLCHYGYPNDLDPFSPSFVERFARFALATARVLRNETEGRLFIAPINEISFFAWAAGDVTYLNPFAQGRADVLKAQLVRACIAAIEAIWSVAPDARIVHPDPLINVVAESPADYDIAEAQRLAQFEAWDMIAGRQQEHLGGHPKYLDILGANYYVHNQRFYTPAEQPPRTISVGDAFYRPFADMLREVHERYGRPILVAETGIEDQARPAWLRYMCGEVRDALEMGVPVEGICLYPVVDHPGWDRGFHRHNGLWGYANGDGDRPIYEPLAAELERQQMMFSTFLNAPQGSSTRQHRQPVDVRAFDNQIDLFDATNAAPAKIPMNQGI